MKFFDTVYIVRKSYGRGVEIYEGCRSGFVMEVYLVGFEGNESVKDQN